MEWSYGVMTISSRVSSTLPPTLASLAAAGFAEPHLFIDDCRVPPDSLSSYNCTCHFPKLRIHGSWMLAAWELYFQKPHADRFAIFQDDLVTYKNLRKFLESFKYPPHSYLNLYTFPTNEHGKGWHLSNQRGLGAVALVFSPEALQIVLEATHMIKRTLNDEKGYKSVDGGIIESMKKKGWAEWVHSPTLVQHTGEQSAIGNHKHPLAVSFRGEDFDAMGLVR
jgi:hypothetical protein